MVSYTEHIIYFLLRVQNVYINYKKENIFNAHLVAFFTDAQR